MRECTWRCASEGERCTSFCIYILYGVNDTVYIFTLVRLPIVWVVVQAIYCKLIAQEECYCS